MLKFLLKLHYNFYNRYIMLYTQFTPYVYKVHLTATYSPNAGTRALTVRPSSSTHHSRLEYYHRVATLQFLCAPSSAQAQCAVSVAQTATTETNNMKKLGRLLVWALLDGSSYSNGYSCSLVDSK
jgi:hypothetical protein